MSQKIFFRPKTGVCADFIPFYDANEFKLYFLRDYRDWENHGEGTPWQLTVTKNLTEFSEEIEVLNRGTVEDQDLYVFTGCINKVGDVYHIFYTGHNPHLRKKGLPEQAVMHAISKDGINFEKIPSDTFFAPNETYEMHDWRDPFIWFDEKEQVYKMLLAARTKEGPAVRKGCTAVCESKDLKKWDVVGNILEPQAYFTHECPDYFEIGQWKYLIFSEFSDRCITRYKMSKDGIKWISPKVDSFDGRAYYAAKSTSNGHKRYLFGWIPTKNKTDNDGWNWGGDLAVHEIYQGKSGILFTRLPEQIEKSFTNTILEKKEVLVGEENKDVILPLITKDHSRYYLECTLEIDKYVTGVGLLLNYDEVNDRGYTYTLNFHNNLFAFDVYPNQPWNLSNFVNVNRPLELKKKYKLKMIVEDNIAVAYLDEKYALSTRMYPIEQPTLNLAIIVKNGKAKIKDLVIKTR